jgi:restriction system protein
VSRRRRYNRRDNPAGAIAVLLFIAAGYLLTAFEQNPLLVSLGGGVLFTAIFWLIWTFLYRRRKKRAQWAASSQLYNDLSDQEFEFAVAELFRLQGFEARVTNRSNDRGIDVYLKKNDQRAAVQCKQYKENIGPAQIREFIGAIHGAGLQQGYFVTTSDYSKMSQEAANKSNYTIHLVNGRILGQWQMKAQKKLKGKSTRTAFIPASWWLQLGKEQKAVVLGLLLLVTLAAATAVSYVAGVVISDALGGSFLS